MFSQGLHSFARIETPWGISRLDEAGIWRLRPRDLRLDAFWGGAPDPQNPWGWAFTDWGQPIVVAGNNGGIFYPLPEMIPGHDDRRVGNIWVDARGRKSSGPDIVGTAHLPPEWQGVLITGGYINNSVWALKIADDGAGFRVNDLPPLITSTHGSFRPIDVKIGPDGAIYIADWYNPIIGHYQASFRHPDRDKTHGRIWRITYKGRPLVQQPPLADAPIESLCDDLKASERWTRFQAKRVLVSRPGDQVTKILKGWCDRLDPDDPLTEHALVEALGVFESLDVIEPRVLSRLFKAKHPEARAFAAEALSRWAGKLPAVLDDAMILADLAHDENPRVRLAAVVAAANIARPDSIITIFGATEQPRDRFIDSALREAVLALKPQWQPLLANAGRLGWKREWIEFLEKSGQEPAPKVVGPATDAKTQEMMRAALSQPVGKLRATPDFVAKLSQEIREKGDPRRGETVFHRPELACIGCHSIAGTGGTIGPPLDSIGSGQPLDFIIGAVLEPQKEVKEGYEALEITTKSGQTIQGYRVREDAAEFTVRDVAEQKEKRIPKDSIKQQRPIGSLMPSGLVDNLSRQDLCDLFRYLSGLGKAVAP